MISGLGLRKFFVRSGRPVMSFVYAFSRFENFPQYTFFFPRERKDREADKGATLLFLGIEAALDLPKTRGFPIGPAFEKERSSFRGFRDGLLM
jgi:hypothetical protein